METKTTTNIDFDRDRLESFKRAYDKCESDTFEFDGHTFLKSYAKYMIEYLEERLK